MLFNFDLFSFPELFTEISPLKERPMEERHISWYTLTDGWYWIDVGTTRLFWYTPQVAEQLEAPRLANGLAVDYYVARLWADLLELLPALLEPLPLPLLQRVSDISAWKNWITARDTWNDERPEETDEEKMEEETDVYLTAARWWYERAVFTVYLVSGPRIWFWSDGTQIHIGWDNRDRLINGIPAWEAQIGQISLPIADFLADLRAFDQLLIARMAKRVAAAPHYWTDPHFARDLVSLQQEHQQRATMLEETFRAARQKEPTDWKHVLSCIARIEEDPLFQRILKEQRMK